MAIPGRVGLIAEEVVLKNPLELLIAVTEYQLPLGALVVALTYGVPIVASERRSL